MMDSPVETLAIRMHTQVPFLLRFGVNKGTQKEKGTTGQPSNI